MASVDHYPVSDLVPGTWAAIEELVGPKTTDDEAHSIDVYFHQLFAIRRRSSGLEVLEDIELLNRLRADAIQEVPDGPV